MAVQPVGALGGGGVADRPLQPLLQRNAPRGTAAHPHARTHANSQAHPPVRHTSRVRHIARPVVAATAAAVITRVRHTARPRQAGHGRGSNHAERRRRRPCPERRVLTTMAWCSSPSVSSAEAHTHRASAPSPRRMKTRGKSRPQKSLLSSAQQSEGAAFRTIQSRSAGSTGDARGLPPPPAAAAVASQHCVTRTDAT